MKFLSLGGDSFAEKVVTCNLPGSSSLPSVSTWVPRFTMAFSTKALDLKGFNKSSFTQHMVWLSALLWQCQYLDMMALPANLKVKKWAGQSKELLSHSLYNPLSNSMHLTPPLVVLTTCLNIYSKKRASLPAERLARWNLGISWQADLFIMPLDINISIHFLWSSMAGIWYPFGLLINRMIL